MTRVHEKAALDAIPSVREPLRGQRPGGGVIMVQCYDVGNGIPTLAVADRPSPSVAEA
jgi:hypothetical protein